MPVYNEKSLTSANPVEILLLIQKDIHLRFIQQIMDEEVLEKKMSREGNESEENEPIAKRIRASHEENEPIAMTLRASHEENVPIAKRIRSSHEENEPIAKRLRSSHKK